jgi:uncharacterized protein (DUF302 family)
MPPILAQRGRHATCFLGQLTESELIAEADLTYYFSTTVTTGFDDAVASAKEALTRHGFKVISQIDMKENFKTALEFDFHPYLILGVCNPQLTYRALLAEDKIGTMLPCNIVIQERLDHRVEISAVDPVASMQAIPHIVVSQVAADIRFQLQSVVAELGEPEWGILEVAEMK